MKKTLLLIAFFLLFPVMSVLAYDYPIGIPHPWIEPDIVAPSRPADWSDEVAGYYYINYQTGSDSYTYGTPTNPKASIPNPIPAGSYVEVHGIYNNVQGGEIGIYTQGTSSQPVWIVGIDGDEPIFQDAMVFVSGAYTYIDNIKINVNGSWAGIQFGTLATGYPANHMMIRNSEIYGHDIGGVSYGIVGVGSSDEPVSNLIAYNNTVHDLSWSGPPQNNDLDADALDWIDYCSYAWALDNTIYNIAGAGGAVGSADVGRSSSAEQHHLYYGRNEVYNTWAVGFAGKYCTDVVFSENHIHDLYDTNWSPAKGLGMQYDGGNTWYLYNTIHDMRYGIRYPGKDTGRTPHSYVIGNLIYNIDQDAQNDPGSTYAEAAIMLFGSTHNYVINNTIQNTYAGINVTGDSPQYNDIENNIIVDASLRGQEIWIEDNNNTRAIVKNNIIRSNDDAEKIKWGNTVYNLTDFQSNTGLGQSCSNSNPQFVSVNDFHLQSSSFARDTALAPTALSTDVYALYQTTFGVDIKKDIENNTRPQGNGWDMGAFEYISSINLRADVDNNSQINTTDAMLTLRNSLGLDMSGTNWQASGTTGDANCDGTSNSTDAMLILRYSLGLDMSGTGWCGN